MLALLRTEVDGWVASTDEMGNAHLVQLSHYWNGAALVLATPRSSPTATNLLRTGVARLSTTRCPKICLARCRTLLDGSG
jgi:hypothetical protein